MTSSYWRFTTTYHNHLFHPPSHTAQMVAHTIWVQKVAGSANISFRGLMVVTAIGFISLTIVHCFGNGYVGKQPVAWKEYCSEFWWKGLQDSMDRCTPRYNWTTVGNGVKNHTISQLNPLPHIEELWRPRGKIFWKHCGKKKRRKCW